MYIFYSINQNKIVNHSTIKHYAELYTGPHLTFLPGANTVADCIVRWVSHTIKPKYSLPLLYDNDGLFFRCCRLEMYPEGKHNIHLRYAELFNMAIDNFLAIPQQ